MKVEKKEHSIHCCFCAAGRNEFVFIKEYLWCEIDSNGQILVSCWSEKKMTYTQANNKPTLYVKRTEEKWTVK